MERCAKTSGMALILTTRKLQRGLVITFQFGVLQLKSVTTTIFQGKSIENFMTLFKHSMERGWSCTKTHEKYSCQRKYNLHTTYSRTIYKRFYCASDISHARPSWKGLCSLRSWKSSYKSKCKCIKELGKFHKPKGFVIVELR